MTINDEIRYENYNMILTEKQQKYQHYHQAKLTIKYQLKSMQSNKRHSLKMIMIVKIIIIVKIQITFEKKRYITILMLKRIKK